MHTLEHTLRQYSISMLAVIAARWDVDLESYSVTDVAGELVKTMLDGESAATTWNRLDDEQRGAMQTLLGSGGKMPAKMFERMFGEIREMGPGKLEREKPYLDPTGVGEVLYYRGLIAKAYAESSTGPQAVIYVPDDLAAVLPTHHTGYDLSAETGEEDLLPEEDADEPTAEDVQLAAEQPDEIYQADTSIVDDLTTLLAYIQVAAVAPVEAAGRPPAIPAAHVDSLTPHLLTPEADRLAFLLGLARAMQIITRREDGLLKPLSSSARRWLEAPRSEQVRQLASAWRKTAAYNDLHHTPGLVVEQADNDPRLAREVVAGLLADMPDDAWWSVPQLITEVKDTQPDFQRPGGSYDSWYIRPDENGDYLRGFESWDAVEGAVLRHILTGPLFWLGLADLGRYAGQTIGHLNAYGRAFFGGEAWPAPPEPGDTLLLAAGGSAAASRKLSRFDRFQLARFTEWIAAGDPYRYRFSLRGLNRAAAQGIEARHIRSYLERVLPGPVPEDIDALLTRWANTANADAAIERLLVLRANSAQALDTMLDDPAIRRYLGARLGPEAVIVREGQAAALQDALAGQGILVELHGAES